MRLSQYFLPTLKETPSEAQIVSHRLMLRAGMIRQARPGARFSGTPAEMRLHASAKGFDTDEILAGIGRNAEEVRALRADGTVA